MLIRLGGFYAPEKKVVAPAESKSVRLTEVLDAEQLKTRMTVVELLQVMNDESYPPEVRFEAAKAACHFVTARRMTKSLPTTIPPRRPAALVERPFSSTRSRRGDRRLFHLPSARSP
jgi:hypothetical protein